MTQTSDYYNTQNTSVSDFDNEISPKIRELRKTSESGYWAACYARMGIKVIPVYHPNDPAENRIPKKGKRPIGQLVTNGCKDATDDIDHIIQWWTQKPDANIGIVPGPSGLIGIDIDGESGRQSLIELEKELGSLPQTWTVTSGRENGGTHYYFRSPEFEVSNRVSWREGIDFRHHGGYLIAPPSVHQTGTRYMWEQSPSKIPLAELPETWLNAIPRVGVPHSVEKKRKQSKQTIVQKPNVEQGGMSDRVKIPPATPTQIERCRKYVTRCPAAINNQGGHNQTFAVAKVIFYDFGLTEEEGWKIFQEYNQRCDPPWSDRELHHKMDDAKHATNKPIGWRRNQINETQVVKGKLHLVNGKYILSPIEPSSTITGNYTPVNHCGR